VPEKAGARFLMGAQGTPARTHGKKIQNPERKLGGKFPQTGIPKLSLYE